MGKAKDNFIESTGGFRIGEFPEDGVPPRIKAIQKLRAKGISTVEDVDRLVALTRPGPVLPEEFTSYEDLEYKD